MCPHSRLDEPESAQHSLVPHLTELRDRLLRAGGAVIGVFLGLAYWAPDIFRFFVQPLTANLPEDGRMIVTDVTASFFVPMKVTLLVAFVMVLPYVLYQVWAFISPGLYKHEKRLVVPLVGSSYVLFLSGMSFAYYVVFPLLFRMLAHYSAPLGVQMATDIACYLDFALSMFLTFGLIFEIPLAVVLCVHAGTVSILQLKQIRPYVIVGAFIIGAIVTPPDVFSQLILAVPLILLYEAGIIFARWLI